MDNECTERIVGDRLPASRPAKFARDGRDCGVGLFIELEGRLTCECFRFRSVRDCEREGAGIDPGAKGCTFGTETRFSGGDILFSFETCIRATENDGSSCGNGNAAP